MNGKETFKYDEIYINEYSSISDLKKGYWQIYELLQS